MKKLVVTTNNANDAFVLSIQRSEPNVNGYTALAQIVLQPSVAKKLRDDLTVLLDHAETHRYAPLPWQVDIPIAPKLEFEYRKAMRAMDSDR